MIDWPVTFSTVSQAIKLASELRSIDKEMSQAELRLKVVELTGSPRLKRKSELAQIMQ